MLSFSANKFSRVTFLTSKRNLIIALVVTCLVADPLFAATARTSEVGQTTTAASTNQK